MANIGSPGTLRIGVDPRIFSDELSMTDAWGIFASDFVWEKSYLRGC
jgi:hypothetical protein